MVDAFKRGDTYYNPAQMINLLQNVTAAIDTFALETKYCQLGQFNTLMDGLFDNGIQSIV